ncbi:MAG TPA: DUF6249 domain-containing protein [Steroidobacteraceae bacterium]|nr:DUF6249 domain-containing protein [Steroidobacteraceae bacterium]
MNVERIIGVSIPVVAMVLGIGIAMLAMYLDFRKKREMIQLYHAERMAAIEKGVELPPLPDNYFSGGSAGRSGPARARRTGLILMFLGIGISLGLWGSDMVGDFWWWGLVPFALGVAFLLAALFESRDLPQSR